MTKWTSCKLNWIRGTLLGMALLATLPSTSSADTLTYAFTNYGNNLDLGTSKSFLYTSASNASFSSSVATLTAYGFDTRHSPTTTDLYYKFGSTTAEQGLGLASDPHGNHEVFVNSSLQIDFSNLAKVVGITDIKFTIGSAQTGENFDLGYKLSQNPVDYTLGTSFPGNPYHGGGSGVFTVDVASISPSIFTGGGNTLKFTGDTIFTLTAVGVPNANVLLDSVTVTYTPGGGFDTPAPAPSSLAMLLGFGAVGFFGHFFHRRRQSAFAAS